MHIDEDVLRWAIAQPGYMPPADRYCQTRDMFSARLDKLLAKSEKAIGEDAYLLTAIAGEIGNNSFDHNLGNWPDIPGVLFTWDMPNRYIAVADRGQGILTTLKRVRPDIVRATDALRIAFTEVISGRFPERRGNGLKFVSQTIQTKQWKLDFSSGNAQAIIDDGNPIEIRQPSQTIQGCLSMLYF